MINLSLQVVLFHFRLNLSTIPGNPSPQMKSYAANALEMHAREFLVNKLPSHLHPSMHLPPNLSFDGMDFTVAPGCKLGGSHMDLVPLRDILRHRTYPTGGVD